MHQPSQSGSPHQAPSKYSLLVPIHLVVPPLFLFLVPVYPISSCHRVLTMLFPNVYALNHWAKAWWEVLHVSGGLKQEKKRLRTTQVEKLAQNLENPSTWEALALELTLVGDMTVTHGTIQECFRAGHSQCCVWWPRLCVRPGRVDEQEGGVSDLGQAAWWDLRTKVKLVQNESWAESELVFFYMF